MGVKKLQLSNGCKNIVGV